MTSKTTFYFSRLVGAKLYHASGKYFGKVLDFLVTINQSVPDDDNPFRPRVVAIKVKTKTGKSFYSYSSIIVTKIRTRYKVFCENLTEVSEDIVKENLLLEESILDEQIVDINGRKVVRVNDIRLVSIAEGVFVIAVDVGFEGLLRRIGIVRPIRGLVRLFNGHLPSKFILWDDVEAIDPTNLNIRLSKAASKLYKLHPSDLADIIEDLGKASKTTIFTALDEEKAADVLEELEPSEQIHIIESLSIEKAADVLERMPADEAAQVLEVLEDEKVEMLLNEMEEESSEEVRELMEYPDRTVGSLMSTEILSFKENVTIEEVLNEIRAQKPEMEALYNLCVVDKDERLIATLSLRDLIISQPNTVISEVMKREPVSVYDYDKVDSLAEIISKYNMLAIPVTNEEHKLEGMVVIDDIVEDLVGEGKTNKA